ncbi:MAG TPA: hypothetical protein VJX71_28080 [Methylomirabilota bacterium]|nr:hypothetical protein [Methylomirabilota bacterium]
MAADLTPVFVTTELSVQHGPEFIAECRLDVATREAPLLAHQARGEPVDRPAQLGETEVDQRALLLSSLSGLLRGFPLLRRLFDQALDERLQVPNGSGRAEAPKGALDVSGQAKPDLPRAVSGQLPLSGGDQRAKPGLAGLGVFSGVRDVR